MSAIQKLDAAIKRVCPIDGVCTFNFDPDRSKWRIDFRPEATEAQRATAEAVKLAFDPLKEDALIDIDAQLAEIDRLTMTGVRGLREFILIQAQLTDHLVTDGSVPVPGEPISGNVGIQKVLQLEQQAIVLRAQRRALTG